MSDDDDDAVELRDVPTECRAFVVNYLTPTELYAGYGICSTWCHADTLGADLPQTTWGELHVARTVVAADASDAPSDEKVIDIEALLRRLSHPAVRAAWQPPRRHMKIVGHEYERDDGARVVPDRTDEMSFEDMRDLAAEIAFEGVTSLDLSLRDRSWDEGVDEEEECASNNRVLPRSLPWLLSSILPGLVEVDFTNLHGGPVTEGDYISELSLFNATNCPNLRKIRWDNRVGGCYFLRGKDMKTLDNLTELYVDHIQSDWRFDKLFAPLMNQFFDEESVIQRFFFFACNKSLERVSLRGGRYVALDGAKMAFPQFALMRFVRRTPTLRWFRSDLSPENVRLLSMERPEVCFCS